MKKKYLLFFSLEKYDTVYDRIRYLVGLKRSITYVFSYNNTKIKIDSNDDLSFKEMLLLHNVVILINLFLINIEITTSNNKCF